MSPGWSGDTGHCIELIPLILKKKKKITWKDRSKLSHLLLLSINFSVTAYRPSIIHPFPHSFIWHDPCASAGCQTLSLVLGTVGS